MLDTKIKVSSVSNLTDARYFAAWGVSWMGFNLDPASGKYIQPQTLQAIRAWIDGPGIVGEFGMQTADEIMAAVDMLSLDAIQAGVFTTAETLVGLQSRIPVIKEIVVEAGTGEEALLEQFDRFAHLAPFFLLNFDKSGITWERIKEGAAVSIPTLQSIFRLHRVFLSLDLDVAVLEEVLSLLRPYGLNLVGGEEERPGFKSFDELDAVFGLLSGS